MLLALLLAPGFSFAADNWTELKAPNGKSCLEPQAGGKWMCDPSDPVSTKWVEGPSAIKIGGECYIYFDHYGDPKYYGAIKSTDMKSWQISAAVSFPKGIRHGTVSVVPASVVQPIQNH